MTRKRGDVKVQYALGFDPGINDSAWAIVGTTQVDDTDEFVGV